MRESAEGGMKELVAGWQEVPPAVAFAWHAQPSGQQSPGAPARSAHSVVPRELAVYPIRERSTRSTTYRF